VVEEFWHAAAKQIAKECSTWHRKDVDVRLWLLLVSFARAGIQDTPLLQTVARRALQEDLATLSGWSVSALLWSATVLDKSEGALDSFIRRLTSEVGLRGIPEDKVNLSWLGPKGDGDRDLERFWASHGPRAERQLSVIAPTPRARRASRHITLGDHPGALPPERQQPLLLPWRVTNP